ncbi:hypothetical protein TVAG_331630 [Trichomonas vaginalis G3]|uniref:Uncharacterized protein n=1 Tax=Trichomonas vaginalis (strain ATCC PRA-98 / G3) TaxID=412133 RepID=A2G314_TRIV3|nr:hypothetical protein TVAGG3_0669210 [Trichomonas vaginalis G3]EAX88447.1 hypothetical protein TVAG_331630 [Trichomonas vaginalis G3]KAI5507071.1 hypothetical protein TVAGG3_0669210 [Trichomonas vaginalis G3]|eukprot:XP_001301377.1 hypothetical protein [Trichomonas vaginalis G3]
MSFSYIRFPKLTITDEELQKIESFRLFVTQIIREEKFIIDFKGQKEFSSDTICKFPFIKDLKTGFTIVLSNEENSIEYARLALPVSWFEKNTVVTQEFHMISVEKNKEVADITVQVHISENGSLPYQAEEGKLLGVLTTAPDRSNLPNIPNFAFQSPPQAPQPVQQQQRPTMQQEPQQPAPTPQQTQQLPPQNIPNQNQQQQYPAQPPMGYRVVNQPYLQPSQIPQQYIYPGQPQFVQQPPQAYMQPQPMPQQYIQYPYPQQQMPQQGQIQQPQIIYVQAPPGYPFPQQGFIPQQPVQLPNGTIAYTYPSPYPTYPYPQNQMNQQQNVVKRKKKRVVKKSSHQEPAQEEIQEQEIEQPSTQENPQ